MTSSIERAIYHYLWCLTDMRIIIITHCCTISGAVKIGISVMPDWDPTYACRSSRKA